MVLTLNWDRILDHHIKQIRKIEKKGKKGKREGRRGRWGRKGRKHVTEIVNRKIKRVFNEVFLNNLKNQEKRSLKKKKKN